MSNACCHVGKSVVVRFDLQDFFPWTTAIQVLPITQFVTHFWKMGYLEDDLITVGSARADWYGR